MPFLARESAEVVEMPSARSVLLQVTMQRTIIAVVDAARARLFTFERSDDVPGIHESLVERADLVNPARRRTPAQLFSDTRTNTSRTGGRFFGVDDHRDAHVDEMDAAFARSIAAALAEAARSTGATRAIVCASPRMLGMLRATDLRRTGMVIVDLDHDYTKLTPTQLHAELVDRGLLPRPPERAGLAQLA